MRFPSRMAFPVLVGIATLTMCSLGIRTELNIAKNSIAEHRAHAQIAQKSIETNKVNHDEQQQHPNIPLR
jgi:hypothetical protein